MHQRLTRILGILGFLAIGFTVWVLGERQTKHLASVTSSVGRSMELGQVRASKEKNSEQNVILNDPAMNLNWGMGSVTRKQICDRRRYRYGN
jgi:hypothetical protein